MKTYVNWRKCQKTLSGALSDSLKWKQNWNQSIFCTTKRRQKFRYSRISCQQKLYRKDQKTAPEDAEIEEFTKQSHKYLKIIKPHIQECKKKLKTTKIKSETAKTEKIEVRCCLTSWNHTTCMLWTHSFTTNKKKVDMGNTKRNITNPERLQRLQRRATDMGYT